MLLALAAGLQLALAGVFLGPLLRSVPHDLAVMTAPVPPPPHTEAMLAFRGLRPLLRAVPADAPVLVVSALAAVQFEYYVLPRPMRLLQALPDEWLRLVEQHYPALLDEVHRRKERLDAKGALLTPDRLAAAVEQAGYVIVAGPPPASLEALRSRLEQVAAHEGFTLFTVR